MTCLTCLDGRAVHLIEHVLGPVRCVGSGLPTGSGRGPTRTRRRGGARRSADLSAPLRRRVSVPHAVSFSVPRRVSSSVRIRRRGPGKGSGRSRRSGRAPTRTRTRRRVNLAVIRARRRRMTGGSNGKTLRPCSPGLSLRGCHCPALRLLSGQSSGSRPVSVRRRGGGGSRVVRILRSFNVRVSSVSTAMNPAVALCRVAPDGKIHVSHVGGLRSSVTLGLHTLNVHVVTPVPKGNAINVRIPGTHPGVISVRDVLGDGGFHRSRCRLPVTLNGAVAGRMFVISLTGVPRLLITNTANRNGSMNLGTVVASLLCGGRPTRLGFIVMSPGGIRFDVCSPARGRFLTGVTSRSSGPVVASIRGIITALGDLYYRVSAHCSLLRGTHTHGVGRCGTGFHGHRLGPRGKRHFVPCVIIVVSRFNSLVVATNGRVRLPVTHVTRLTHTINVRVVVTARHPAAGVVANAVGTGFPTHVTFGIDSHVSSRAVLSHPNTGRLVKQNSVLFLDNNRPIHMRYTFMSAPRIRHVAGCVTGRRDCLNPFRLPGIRVRNRKKDKRTISVTRLSPLFRRTTHLVITARRNSASVVRHGFTVNCGHTKQLVSRLRRTNVINVTRNDGPHSILYVSRASLRVQLGGLEWEALWRPWRRGLRVTCHFVNNSTCCPRYAGRNQDPRDIKRRDDQAL